MGTVCFHGGNMATAQILAMNTVNDGATWSDIIAITDAADMHHVIPDISYDSYNAVHVVWHEIDPLTQVPGQVKYVQLTTEGVTDQQFVTPDDYPSAFPSIVVDADDEVHVAVQTFTDDNYEIYYLTSKD
jgi:isopentenyldiphosphate isomerase